MRVGRRRQTRSLDPDGVDPQAWSVFRAAVDAAHRKDGDQFAQLLAEASEDPPLYAKIAGYALIMLSHILLDGLGPEPSAATLTEYVQRVDLDFLSVVEQNAGVDIIDLAARAATGVEPAPDDDAETVAYMIFGAVAAIGGLLPYPLAETTNRRARLARDLRQLPANLPYRHLFG